MAVSDTFVGKVFGTVEDAKEAVSAYNVENFTEFVVETNNKKALVFKCKNGVHRSPERSTAETT